MTEGVKNNGVGLPPSYPVLEGDLAPTPVRGVTAAETDTLGLPALPPLPGIAPPPPGAGDALTEPRGSAQTPTETEPVRGPTPQTRINELADAFIERVRAGDEQGALAILHGQRRIEGDAHFAQRFQNALTSRGGPAPGEAHHVNLLIHGQSPQFRFFMNVYLSNPGGMSRPEDVIEYGIRGWGTGESVINDAYAGLGVEEREAMEARWLEKYGGRHGDPASLESFLTEGFFSELGGDDRRQYRAARIDAQSAMDLWSAGQGVIGADDAQMVRLLARNIGRIEAYADEYGYVADGVEGQGLARFTDMIDDELGGSEAEIARILIDTDRPVDERAARAIDATLRGVLEGSISEAEARELIVIFAGEEDSPLGNGRAADQIDQSLAARVIDSGFYPELAPTVRQLAYAAPDITRGETVVADFERFMEPTNPRWRQFGEFLDTLTDEQRADLLAAVPDIEERLRARYGPVEIQDRLILSATGQADAADYLHWVDRSLASEGGLLAKVNMLPMSERVHLATVYDQRHGEGAFESAVDGLDNDTARALRMAISVPTGASRNEIDSMVGGLSEIVGEERTPGFSRWFNDRFGFSGPVVDDALRELVTTSDRVAEYYETHGEILPEHVNALTGARERLERAIITYDEEREDIAAVAADAAIVAVSVATLGAGLTATTIARAALAAGVTNAGTRGVVQGTSDYSTGEAMYDVFSGAALELAGIGAASALFAGGRRAWTALRR